MPDPVKLELLTRNPGEVAFQIVELDSSHAYWAFKPQRLPATEWELTPQPVSADGARKYVLKNLRHDRYLLLDSKEYFLWEHCDGRHSLEEIARAVHLAAGAFDYAIIRQSLAKLYHCGLLDRSDAAGLQPSRAGAGSRASRSCWSSRCRSRSSANRLRKASYWVKSVRTSSRTARRLDTQVLWGRGH